MSESKRKKRKVRDFASRDWNHGKMVLLARDLSYEAMKVLANIMRNKDIGPASRVKAAEIILNRAWGQAPAVVKLEGEVDAVIRRIVLDDGLPSPYRQIEQAPPELVSSVDLPAITGDSPADSTLLPSESAPSVEYRSSLTDGGDHLQPEPKPAPSVTHTPWEL